MANEQLSATLIIEGLGEPAGSVAAAGSLARASARPSGGGISDPTTAHHRFGVVAFEGAEAINELYRFEIEFVASNEILAIEELALGRDAVFELRSGPDRLRRIHGIVASVELVEASFDRPETSYRAQIVPRLHLLTLRTNSRVFQQLRADEIIRRVLAPYFIPVHFSLHQQLPARTYCCQLEETDFDFIRRVAADHGLMFFFEHPARLPERGLLAVDRSTAGLVGLAAAVAKPQEVLVFTDHSSACMPLSFDGGEQLAAAFDHALAAARSALGSALGQQEGESPPSSAATASAVGEAAFAQLGEHARSMAGERPIVVMRDEGGGALGRDEMTMLRFSHRRAVRPSFATYREYDPRRPRLPFSHHAEVESFDDPVASAAAAVASRLGPGATDDAGASSESASRSALYELFRHHRPTEIYRHNGAHLDPAWDYERREPERMLREARRDASLAAGASECPWMSAAHTFSLSSHRADHLNRDYVVVGVRHHGRWRGEGASYANSLECIPAGVLYSAPREPHTRNPNVYGAVVVGGADVHTNDQGMVRVRFHFDRENDPSGESTCWLRVLQPWAGAGYGAQFLPRPGTEVLVGFESGDPDRPVVLGGLYNATHPMPFALPEQSRKSGFRSRSVPGGQGGNELSFDDSDGAERLLVHASRDLAVEATHDRRTRVGHDDELDVRGNASTTIDGQERVEVKGAREHYVRGGEALSVSGASSLQVEQDRTLAAGGSWGVEVARQATLRMGGRFTLEAGGDVVQRTAGNLVQIVASDQGTRSLATHVEGTIKQSASESITLIADQSIVLQCGKTALKLTPERAELSGPVVLVSGDGVQVKLAEGSLLSLADDKIQLKAKTVLLRSSGAAMGLTSEAAVEGSRVLLNSPQMANDAAEESSLERTEIVLTDQAGEPIANHPYRVVLGDGSELSGSLDSEGKATLVVDEEATIFFPGLPDVREQ